MTEQMNPRVKKLWVRALRRKSNNRQFKNGLGSAKDSSRCCLGVLCDIAVKEGIIPPPILTDTKTKLLYDGALVMLPPKVMNWAGLGSVDPLIKYNGRTYPASWWNDIANKNFDEIADMIEQSL